MEKVCIKCKENKLLEDFGKHSKSIDGLQSRCKICKRVYDNLYHTNRNQKQRESKRIKQTDRYNLTRRYIFNYLRDKSCKVCGENRVATLDFHHLKDKSFNISEGISKGYSLTKIKKEIEKCEILCSNCHRIETAEEFNWYTGL